MTKTSDHPYVETIRRYYEGCNTGDFDLMMSTFTEDVAHYFVDHAPVVSGERLANYWVKVGPRTQAHWTVDHALVEEPEAVIEWSMRWTPLQTGIPEIMRGAEWYVFRGDRIAEIRCYHHNHFLTDSRNRELWDFDYIGRGYTM